MRYGIGQSAVRVEDQRFLTGNGRYLDDITPAGCLHAVMVRSPSAHARIRKIDVTAARDLPGVVAVYTDQDWQAAGLGPVPTRAAITNLDGSPVCIPARWPLARGRVRHVGDGIAFVVASSRAIADDAAQLVTYEMDELPAVIDSVAALSADAPAAVHDEAPDNRSFTWQKGDPAQAEAALAKAAHVAEVRLHNNRIVINPMETRGVLCIYDAEQDFFTVSGSIQNVFMYRQMLAEKVFDVPLERMRVVAYDVGGGFGGKNQVQPEHLLTVFAARELKCPVKWVADRSEGFLTDGQGRDQQTRVRLALDKDHRFTALHVETTVDLGAYVSTNGTGVPTGATTSVMGGPYDIPAVYNIVHGAFTNTVPTDAYRGAGRPEACFLLERVVDVAAAELGVDPMALRRQNFIAPASLPYKASLGHTIDSGDFAALLDRALAQGDVDGFAARAQESRARGKLRGLGVASYLEATLGVPTEYARLEFDASGAVTLAVGTQSNGQSHETTFAQIVSEKLRIDFDQIRFRQSDTDQTPIGHGHGGSRSLQLAGSAILNAADKLVEKAKVHAAELLEAAAEDIDFDNGTFRVVGTDRRVNWPDIAAAALSTARPAAERGLSDEDTYTKDGTAYPNGCHIAEIEIDPATGMLTVERYTALDDFGRIVNPMVVTGQVMGGIMQGVGQAVLEHTVYDPVSGQLLSGSFMDYCMPRASDLPDTDIAFFEDAPTRTSPIGAKGCGEAGTIAGPPAIASAICNALGVTHVDMPYTPEKVWQLIQKG
ncbi:MAG: xanthine dehydrogenase family protein molybdopterin-binding subunit [Minwuia sp.]|nr:xanthine dehydrogenase family protein molybdopterin-binding subunit [Minwuia sp.]